MASCLQCSKLLREGFSHIESLPRWTSMSRKFSAALFDENLRRGAGTEFTEDTSSRMKTIRR